MDDKKKDDFFNGFDDDILIDDDFEENEEEEKDSDESNSETQPAEKETKEESVKSTEVENEAVETETDAERKAKEAEKNARYAEMRRKQEAEQKAEIERVKKEATTQAELGLLKENPYTGEKINDESDLNIYKLQRELEKEGKDPVKDLPKRIAEIERQKAVEANKAKEAEVKSKQEVEERAKRETTELLEAYPKLNAKDLVSDPLWKKVCEGKLNRLTLKEIYELCYLPAKQVAQPKDNENAKQMTKVPSSTTHGGNSKKDFLEMTDEEYLKFEKDNKQDDFF